MCHVILEYDYDFESVENYRFTLEDLKDIGFFIDHCFQDHDSYYVSEIFEVFFKDPSIEDYISINLEEYEDLVSEDIFQKYKKIKVSYKMFKNLMKDKVSLEKQNGEIITNIQSNVKENEIFIVDSSLKIEEGDRITRSLPNGLKEGYIVTNSIRYGKKFSIPAHYELRVRKETAIEHERFQTIINDNSTTNITGDYNRVNKHSTDNSTNTSIKETEFIIFNQLKEIIEESDISVTEKDKIISNINELKESVGTSNYQSKYQHFIASAANHMTIIAPFIPELTKLLGI
ncbi:hypothetical protein ACQKGD_15565 [Peribacillus frigoritolerans]|uniref:hypothetical protein n=1 Tax=Peribacillus frigoritolerans TaxID=450367 RepID=UPI002079E73F|nr:hypothetical protein [Peribacillus frigoritolerans]USK64832.1 hypothetical protein LIT26_27635 [Peribacillus frigoritolerans]